jgi:hypothetical protein
MKLRSSRAAAAAGAGLAFALSLSAAPVVSWAQERSLIVSDSVASTEEVVAAESSPVVANDRGADSSAPVTESQAPSTGEPSASEGADGVNSGAASGLASNESDALLPDTTEDEGITNQGAEAPDAQAGEKGVTPNAPSVPDGAEGDPTSDATTPTEQGADESAGTTNTDEGETNLGGGAKGTVPSETSATQPDASGEKEQAVQSEKPDVSRYQNLYRLYNPNSGEHFYTSSLSEMLYLAGCGWRYEGVGWVAPVTSGTPVYRMYNPNAGDHHYTTNAAERDMLRNAGWKYEGIGWYSDGSSGTAVFRQYNPNAASGSHNFTTSAAERGNLVKVGWSDEGIAWYGSNHATVRLSQGRWIVTSAWGSLQRYWLGQDATIARSRLVDPSEGSGWYARATSDGSVVRGKYVDRGTGYVYLANNDGRLEGPGRVTTSAYDDGARHSYLIDETAHAAIPGLHALGNGTSLTLSGSGWLLQGGSGSWNDQTYLADANAVLAPNLTATFATQKGKQPQTVRSFSANGMLYVFLPSYASLSNVTLGALLQDGSPVNALVRGNGDFVALDGSAIDLATLCGVDPSSKSVTLSLAREGYDSVFQVVVMRSSGVETIFLNSEDPDDKGRAFVEADPHHNTKANVEVVAIADDGTVVYSKDNPDKGKFSTVKGRGNSTWGGKKKPYQISLNKKADLLQTGEKDNAQKKWILLANANDASQLHSTIAYNLALELGMVGVECRPVDLYYDGEYRGSYLLTEKVEIKPGRVDIDSLEDRIEEANPDVDLGSLPTRTATNKYGYTYQYVEGAKDPDDISGGYLLEIDNAWYKGETCWFQNSDRVVVVKSPEVASKDAIRRISEAYEEALRNARANRFNLSGSYSMDLDSLSKTWLLSEFCKNIDAFNTSTYLYLDSGSKTFMAQPVWDFDGSMGVRTDWPNSDFSRYEDIVIPTGRWVIGIPSVQRRAKAIYRNELSKLVGNVRLSNSEDAVGDAGHLHSLAYYRSQVSDSQAMDKVVWGISVMRNEVTPFHTWGQNVDYLVHWLSARNAWFGTNASHLGDFDITNRPFTYGGFDYGLVYDYDYYLQMNPDVAAAFHGDPELTLRHFVEHGMAEGRASSRMFDLATYKANNPDVVAAFGSRTAEYYRHYCTYGFKEARVAV